MFFLLSMMKKVSIKAMDWMQAEVTAGVPCASADVDPDRADSYPVPGSDSLSSTNCISSLPSTRLRSVQLAGKDNHPGEREGVFESNKHLLWGQHQWCYKKHRMDDLFVMTPSLRSWLGLAKQLGGYLYYG
jgi:hypothetical protein